MTAYADLMAFQRDTEALAQVAGRLGWDQETMMPPGAAEQRAEEMAAMESILHARRTDPRIVDWVQAIEPDGLDEAGRAALRLIWRRYDRNSRVNPKLAAEIARVTSVAQGVWARARAAEEFAAFAPTLERVVNLRQQEAAALSKGSVLTQATAYSKAEARKEISLYDALLDDFEPGATAAGLETLFGALRPRLVALREKILHAPHQPVPLTGEFSESGQLMLSKDLALAFGYDLNHGRIDKAVHPFSSGSGLDVRITTRTNPTDPFNCFYSTIHEVGHAGGQHGGP